MVDQEKVKEAVSLLLEAIGEDPGREGLKDTPDRIARMYTELLAGMEADPAALFEKTFETNDTEMIIEKDITFHSMCEHHLMPFMGKVHIAYIPDGKVAGLSKLCRIVEVYARRLQLQERMTDQIAEAMMTYLQPKGVLVFTEAEHTCVTMRGIKKPGTITQTYAVRGVFKDNPELQNRAFNLIK